MDKKIKELVWRELRQLHCSILLEEVKTKVNKLKAYGVTDNEIEAILHDIELFPQLIVTKDYQLVLSGTRRMVVKMEPLVKAVYLLFLAHPEGIVLKCLPDYRKELTALYLQLRPYGMTDRVKKSIEDVTNPTLNSINEKCAKIRKLFSEILPKAIARYYSISGKRGEAKQILLPRNHITWECDFTFSQAL